MPELPEVETLRRQLEPVLGGRTILRAKVLDPLIVAPVTPAAFTRRIRNQEIARVGRRGKYLRLALSSGLTLVLHLRMTGRLTHSRDAFEAVDRRHLRLFLWLDDGSGLAFHDQRRFGKAVLLTRDEADTLWSRIGPEPLERSFNAAGLRKILDNRRGPVKTLLMDQALIAGIGNIYADEALFRAGIHPLRPAAEVTSDEAASLSRAIKATLRHAIALEGSSIDTYRTTSGERGRFQETFRVHRRAGEPCPQCGGIVEKIKVGGRGTYFCPACQK